MKVCMACGGRFDSDGWTCPICRQTPAVEGEIVTFVPRGDEESDVFDPSAFAGLAAAETANFWFRSRNRLITWALEEYFPGARSFLEIGCGTGFVLKGVAAAAPALALTGSDMFIEGLEFARRRTPDARFIQADARRLPYYEEFDVAGAFDVLEHVDDDDAVLGQLRQAIAPGGGLIVTVPQHPWLWSAADDAGYHKRRYRRRELVSKVQRAGFEIARVTSFVTLLLPLMVAARRRPRLRRDGYQPQSELELHQTLNAVFEKALNAEAALIRRGVSLPVGGSLLAVAYRR